MRVTGNALCWRTDPGGSEVDLVALSPCPRLSAVVTWVVGASGSFDPVEPPDSQGLAGYKPCGRQIECVEGNPRPTGRGFAASLVAIARNRYSGTLDRLETVGRRRD